MLTLTLCPFHPRVTTVARKRPWSFCQNCRWQVTSKHAYTLDPMKSEWANYAAVQAECGNLSGTSSQATCQGTLSHSYLSSLSHCRLILALTVQFVCGSLSPLQKKKKKCRQAIHGQILFQRSLQVSKKPPVTYANFQQRQLLVHDYRQANVHLL